MMRKAKAFFFVCAGILALALAFHLGAQTATSQIGNEVGYCAITGSRNYLGEADLVVVTRNGDVWGWPGKTMVSPTGIYHGNIFSGAPTQSIETTWGRIKADRR